ncbi:integrating conjugative element protein, partial [Serratia marcescens]
MKKVNFLLFGLSLVTTTALANLNVIADIGGDDASPYFEGINRQGDAVAPPAM